MSSSLTCSSHSPHSLVQALPHLEGGSSVFICLPHLFPIPYSVLFINCLFVYLVESLLFECTG